MYVCMYAQICTCVFHVYICIDTQVCIYVFVFLHSHIYIHTYKNPIYLPACLSIHLSIQMDSGPLMCLVWDPGGLESCSSFVTLLFP